MSDRGVQSEQALRRTTLWLLGLTVLFILYASLYPFEFDPGRLREASRGEWLRAFAWRRPIRSDLIANLIFYLPFGALLTYLTPRRWGALRRCLLVLAAGAALSSCIELAQFATRDRDPSIADVAMNAVSAGLAAALTLLIARLGVQPVLPQLRGPRPDALALTWVVLWLAFHAAPFMPTARFIRYFVTPELLWRDGWSVAAVSMSAAGYVLLGAALRSLFRPVSFWPVFATGAVLSLLARITFRGQQLELSECLGLLLALPMIWHLATHTTRHALSAAAWAVALALLVHGLAGFGGGAAPPAFAGLEALQIVRRTGAAEPGLLESAFLYGGCLWLFTEAGVRLRRALPWLLGAALLLELAQAWQPGRSAHLAAPLAVLLAAALGAVRRTRPQPRILFRT